jgi:hypothetical protein
MREKAGLMLFTALLLVGIASAKDKCDGVPIKILNTGFTTAVIIVDGQSVSRTQNWWRVQVEGGADTFLYSASSKGVGVNGYSYLFTDNAVESYHYTARLTHAVKDRGGSAAPEWKVCEDGRNEQTFSHAPFSTRNAVKTESFICPANPKEGSCTKLGD